MFDTTLIGAYGGLGTRFTYEFSALEATTDLSRLASISFDCKGNGHHLEISLYSKLSNTLFHVVTVSPLPSAWTHQTIPISTAIAAMTTQDQQKWQRENRFISQFIISVTRDNSQMPATGDLWIDNIEFQYN